MTSRILLAAAAASAMTAAATMALAFPATTPVTSPEAALLATGTAPAHNIDMSVEAAAACAACHMASGHSL